MRVVAHGVAFFSPEKEEAVRSLMKVQCSATRSAYQFMRKTGHVTNEVKKHVKTRYMADLNQRYISDACGMAAQIRAKPSVIFGGKRAWKAFLRGTLTKDQWQERRNSILFSRGDKTKKGNPNIRIIGANIFINDPSGRRLWIKGKVFIPAKFNFDPACYAVRLRFRGGKMQVWISSDIQAPALVTNSNKKGVIGVDCNPHGCALAETDGNGNLLHHHFETEQRIRFARKEKRSNDVRLLAKRIVGFALEKRKPLILEKLFFWGGKQRGAKFNRMKSNFLHKQMLDTIKSRAAKQGVEVIEVKAAYTSILGKLKYMDMYSLNNHAAAALVIARRGMGINERQTFTDTLRGRGGSRVHLEGKSRSHTLMPKSWSWMQGFLASEIRRAHSPSAGSCNPAGIGSNSGEVPEAESRPITSQSRRQEKPDVNGE